MKKTITTILFSFILAMSYGQKSQDIVGNWKFRKLKISNQNCKDFDHLTISAFTFADNGKAVFKHSRGTAEASYKLENNIIKLFDLSENGVKQEVQLSFL